jgi:putative methionine-R-sulfoxide reductase with GAF domain
VLLSVLKLQAFLGKKCVPKIKFGDYICSTVQEQGILRLLDFVPDRRNNFVICCAGVWIPTCLLLINIRSIYLIIVSV